MTKQRVLVGYTHGGKVDGAFTKSLLDLQRFEDRHPAETYELLDIEHAPGLYVHENRNTLIKLAQRAGADWLLQLDSDITFDRVLLRILMRTADPATRPIISGLYANVANLDADGNGSITVVDMIFQETPDGTYVNLVPPSETQPFEVPGACGAGMLLTHMSVFEKLTYPWFVLPYIKPTGRDDYQFMNEDIAFCREVREAGYPLWCDPLAHSTHWKTVPVSPSLLRNLLNRRQQFERELENARAAEALQSN